MRTEDTTSPVPVLEEAPEAEGHQLQRGLDHEGGGEEVVAVLQSRLQGLKETETQMFSQEMVVPVSISAL